MNTASATQGAVIYAKNLAAMSAFYAALTGWKRGAAEDDFVVLETAAFTLTLVAIPKAIADSITIASPPERREETPIKLVLAVDDLAATRALVATLGGELNPPEREWTFGGSRVCDGHDPEGNVFQVSTRATRDARAEGSFVVRMAPLPLADANAAATLGRMSLDKTFSGGLEAVAKGEMLMAGTAVKGSAGYVAIDHVTGTLDGHRGSFALQHTGTMNKGVPTLSITVVPDSGTDQLTGLTGRLTIVNEGGAHRYVFDYSL